MNSGWDTPCGVGFPIRKFPDQRLLPPPRNLSQGATSFIASRRQGIHQMPFSYLILHARWQNRSPTLASRLRPPRRTNNPAHRNTVVLPSAGSGAAAPAASDRQSTACGYAHIAYIRRSRSSAIHDVASGPPHPRGGEGDPRPSRTADQKTYLFTMSNSPDAGQPRLGRPDRRSDHSSLARPGVKPVVSSCFDAPLATPVIPQGQGVSQSLASVQRPAHIHAEAQRPASPQVVPGETVVEPDGIEPTTSSLQS